MGTEKLVAARGIYAGISHLENGKLLLIRRTNPTSIIPGVSFKGNWELPGGAVMASEAKSVPYNYYLDELCRHLKEKTGIVMPMGGLPAMHSVFFKGPAGYDEASVIPMICDVKPTIGETLWVSPCELRVLADELAG